MNIFNCTLKAGLVTLLWLHIATIAEEAVNGAYRTCKNIKRMREK